MQPTAAILRYPANSATLLAIGGSLTSAGIAGLSPRVPTALDTLSTTALRQLQQNQRQAQASASLQLPIQQIIAALHPESALLQVAAVVPHAFQQAIQANANLNATALSPASAALVNSSRMGPPCQAQSLPVHKVTRGPPTVAAAPESVTKARAGDDSSTPEETTAVDEDRKPPAKPKTAPLKADYAKRMDEIKARPSVPRKEPSRHEPFPHRLYRLLMEAEQHEQTSIVSFMPSGKSFHVYDRVAFMKEVNPRYFRHAKFSSFKRQLYLYDFTQVRDGPEKEAYCHPCFVRGQPELLDDIPRVSEGFVRRQIER